MDGIGLEWFEYCSGDIPFASQKTLKISKEDKEINSFAMQKMMKKKTKNKEEEDDPLQQCVQKHKHCKINKPTITKEEEE